MMMQSLILSAGFFLLSPLSFGSESTKFLDQEFPTLAPTMLHLPGVDGLRADVGDHSVASDTFQKTKIVLDYFQVPAELSYDGDLNSFRISSSAADAAALLRYFDPAKQYGRFFTEVKSDSSSLLQSFYDRDSKSLNEYRLELPQSRAPQQLLPGSLKGMRIALDPGHMGGNGWDERTGKYVKDGNGVRVSEGVINLQTALLVEKQMLEQGAQVMITHRELAPVTQSPYEDFDVQAFGRLELRSRSLQDWFLSLLSGSSDNLGKVFSNSPKVKKLFSDVMKDDYYAMREDITARADAIDAFHPDLTIIIHYDAELINPDSKIRNKTRSYVAGAFGIDEFATSESRAHLLTHLAQNEQWQKSVALSKSIVGEMSRSLNVPLPEDEGGSTVTVAPGVFARNLGLTRKVIHSPVAYLECLVYGNKDEFYRLSKKDGGVLNIGGKDYAYSSRLQSVADAITKGTLNFLSQGQ